MSDNLSPDNNSISSDNVFETIQNSIDLMDEDFDNTFFVGRTFSTIAEARSAATEFGFKHNVVFVTVRSDSKKMKLNLACKHFGEYRPAVKKAGITEGSKGDNAAKIPYEKDTQRSNCPCEIKLRKSSHGGLIVTETDREHTHPIPESRTTYAIHRQQSAETMALIMDAFALSGDKPVQTAMQVKHTRPLIFFFNIFLLL